MARARDEGKPGVDTGMPDWEESRRATTVRTIAWTFAGAGSLVCLSPLYEPVDPLALAMPAISVLLSLACVALVRRGHVHAASAVMLVEVWVVTTVSIVIYGGIQTPAYSGYTIGIITAGLLLGGRVALGFAAVSALSGALLAWLGHHGALPPPVMQLSTFGIWWVEFALFGVAGGLLAVARRATRDAFESFRRSERALAERNEELQRSGGEVRAYARQQEGVAELGLDVIRAESIDPLLLRAVGIVASVLEDDFADVLEWDREIDVLVLRAAVGWSPEGRQQARIPVERVVLEGGEPVVIGDLRSEPDFPGDELLRREGVRSSASVLIGGPRRPFGLLSSRSRTPRAYGKNELRFLQNIATLLSTALERASAMGDLRADRERMHQSQKMEALGRLASGVAHDFNNLLTAIGGYGALLLDELGPQHPLREDLDQILDAVQRGGDLTRRLLAFSREQPTELGLVDLNEVITRAKPLLRRLIGEDVELALSLDPTAGHIRADPGQIEQVLMNLVVNARDAMPQGGLIRLETDTLDLDATRRSAFPNAASGRYVALRVSDTGIGMTEDTAGRIFEPFFTTKPPGTGTGLGLSTVLGIVQQAGGDIAVETRPAEGTHFEILLPRVRDEETTRLRVAPTEVAYPMGHETLLLVEDDDAVRALASAALRSHGYRVLEAAGGREAQILVKGHPAPIELLVTDVVMSGMGGPELAEWLLVARPSVRVLFVSGYPPAALAARGVRDSGRFLAKPFTPSALARKVREILDAPAA